MTISERKDNYETVNTSVSQEQRRLHERMQHDKKIVTFMHQLDRKCNG